MSTPTSYKIFGWLFKHNPFNKISESMEKTLTKARLPISGDIYLSSAITQSILASLLLTPLVIAILYLDLLTPLKNLLPQPIPTILNIFPFFPLIALPITLLYFYLKPRYIMIQRKQNIDQNIHHASAFLYAMTKSGLQPIDALERLSQQKSIYGLISEEFGMAIRRVKYFGESLNNSLKYVANTTSSKNLKEFIFSFILATQQSLSVGTYFKRKFEEFFEKEKRERETLMKTMNLIGEVAVVLVALSPTLVLATSLALGVLNPGIITMFNMFMILILPFSSIILLIYIRAVLPSHKLIAVTKTVFKMPLIENVQLEKTESTEEKDFDSRDKRLLFKNALKKPIQLFFTYPWFYYLLAFIALTLTMTYFYTTGTNIQQLLVYTLLGFSLIILIPHEIKSRYVIALERRIPDFLRGLSETVEREGSVIRAINLVLKSKLGFLRREMRKITSTKLGVSLKQAILMIEYRTASIVLKRVLSLLVIASESTRNMKDILIMTADDAESYVKLRRERTFNLVGFLISTYVCFGVYVYVYWTLKNEFIPTLSQLPGFTAGALFSSVMVQGYYISLFLAVILGLTIGAMLEGSILSGLKHSIIMIIVTILMLGWTP
jgi:flagellar protein FlaJ